MVLRSIHAATADNVGADGVLVEERKRPDDFHRRKGPVAPLAADPPRRVQDVPVYRHLTHQPIIYLTIPIVKLII